MDEAWKAGLEDVVAARSGVCTIDGAAGRLYYRGYEIGDLAGAVPFEDVTSLLWFGELPTPAEARTFRARLAEGRALPVPVVDLLRTLPRDSHPLDVLRTAVSFAALLDADAAASDPEANLRKAFRLMTLIPAVVAAWHRIRTGREPVTIVRADSHAAWFLAMLEGQAPSADVARVMDLALTLHADHEFNASTFAARVAVATRADLHAAIVAAIATLKGPSHGGANEDVLLMLREIGDPAKRGGIRRGAARHARHLEPAAAHRPQEPGARASGIASIAWTMPGRGCCAAWPSRWPRPPVASGCSRSPSASTTRCAPAPRCP